MLLGCCVRGFLLARHRASRRPARLLLCLVCGLAAATTTDGGVDAVAARRRRVANPASMLILSYSAKPQRF
jgi:hypothetical protein